MTGFENAGFDHFAISLFAPGLAENLVGSVVTKLEKFAGDLARRYGNIKQNPSKVPNYSLIAFDPEAPPYDPVTLEVLGILKEAWPTYVNTFASTAIQIHRAIILDALVSSAQEDEGVAVAFAACARSVLPFMETGNEFSIWVECSRQNRRFG
ncbi:MAG TPA: GTPase-associated system all-helical protein GASH [Acidobacteriaceae bacterium]|jgi:hypothetical protein